jgi:hypothetical protein
MDSHAHVGLSMYLNSYGSRIFDWARSRDTKVGPFTWLKTSMHTSMLQHGQTCPPHKTKLSHGFALHVSSCVEGVGNGIGWVCI